MKRTFVVAIAGLVVAALNSCDMRDPVSPAVSPETSVESGVGKSACGGLIGLSEEIPFSVIGPRTNALQQSAHINGSVTYGVKQSPVLQRNTGSVSLEFSAVLDPPGDVVPVYMFVGESTDQVVLSTTEPTFLLKTYWTSHPSGIVTLYVKYEITSCTISIDRMWAVKLPLPDPDPSAL